MPCPSCGASNPEQAVQCSTCGAQRVATGASSGGSQWGAPLGSSPAGSGPTPYAAYPSSPASNQPISGAGQLASWGHRVGATLIDGVILLVVELVLGSVGGRTLELVIGFVVGLAYTSLLLAGRGQTVGMMAVGTRCVKEGTDANLLIGPAIGRYVVAYVLDVTLIGGVLDVLWPLWDRKNQTLHDKAVHSLVVRIR